MKKINAKLSKLLNTKKKRNIFALVLVALIGVIGVTIAYFATTTAFKNIFKTPPFNVTVYEVFESPDNWTPGTTTPKEVYATNNSNVDVAVRISYEEEWVAADGTELPLEQDGNRAAIINLANEEDWTQSGQHFYYIEDLKPGETTSSFMESVTFNPEITGSYTCTKDEDGHDECTSTGTGYDGATYTLTLTIDMVQADAKEAIWGEIYVCPSPSTYPGEDLTSTSIDTDGTYLTNDFRFLIDTENNTATIVSYLGAGGSDVDLVIPKSIDGITVTVLNNGAFSGKTFRDVTLSPYLESIQYYAFQKATINSVNFDYAQNIDSVTGFYEATIAQPLVVACSPKATSATYFNAISVPSITLKNLVSLKDVTYFYDSTINELTIENSALEYLYGFNNSTIKTINLKNIESFTTIPYSAVNYSALENFNIENVPNIHTIQGSAFAGTNISSFDIQEYPNLEVIESSAFYQTKLTELNISNHENIKSIGGTSFNETPIQNVIIENNPNLETIGDSAFSQTNLKNILVKDCPKLEVLGTVNGYNNSDFMTNEENFVDKVHYENLPNVTSIGDFNYLVVKNVYLKDLPKATNKPYVSDYTEIYVDNVGITKLTSFGRKSLKKVTIKNLYDAKTMDTSAFTTGKDSCVLDTFEYENLPVLENFGPSAFEGCKVDSLILEDLPSLKSIDDSAFFYNPLSTLIIRNLPELKQIEHYAFWELNDVVVPTPNFALENLPKLEYIESSAFRNQGITEFNVKNLPSLKYIEGNAFRSNQIKEISLDAMPNIEGLYAQVFDENPLEVLDMSAGTKLNTVYYVIQYTKNLKELNLSGIKNVENFGTSGDMYVDKVILNGTGDSSSSNGNFTNSFLNQFNEIGELDATNSAITNLDLYANIGKIKLTGSKDLKTLYLSKGTFTEIDLDGLDVLDSVTIYANALTDINFGSTKGNIKSLFLNNTKISELDLSEFNSLNTLGLNGAAYKKLRIPASVTEIYTSVSSSTIECIEILGDSTRFDADFEKIFGVTKTSISDTCSF